MRNAGSFFIRRQVEETLGHITSPECEAVHIREPFFGKFRGEPIDDRGYKGCGQKGVASDPHLPSRRVGEKLRYSFTRGDALKRRCEELLRAAEVRVEKITLDATGKPSGTEPLEVG
jgi:hypothetical protein